MPSDQEHNAGIRVLLSVNFNHDGSAVLLVDGAVAGYVNTERFSRIKKHPGLREEDLDELLDQAGIGLADVDLVMLCNLHNMDSPDIVTLHGSDLKDTWFEFWLNQAQNQVQIRGHRLAAVVNPDHHLIHAATAYYTSPFSSGVALAIDPAGCRGFIGQENKLYPVLHDFDVWFNANVGYTSVAKFMFGSGIVGAGKVMALAPYGEPADPAPAPAAMSTFEELMTLAHQDPKIVDVGGRSLNATLAYYIQAGLERQVTRVFKELGEICVRNGLDRNIAMSGGTALNVVANQIAFDAADFDSLYLHPACGDDGTAIGAALWYWHHVLGNPRQEHKPAQQMYSVREYSPEMVQRAVDKQSDRLVVEQVADHAARAAELVAGGAVIGWYQGASEVGPRALGHRSIVADPRGADIQDRINATIKFREFFRPFAPSVLDEHSKEWFGIDDSPYMLRAAQVSKPDVVPGITHVDGSARIQTVRSADNPDYHRMISAFHERTGVPLVLNTSLNVKGEPIVETPEDAVRTLLDSELDYLVLPNLVLSRRGER